MDSYEEDLADIWLGDPTPIPMPSPGYKWISFTEAQKRFQANADLIMIDAPPGSSLQFRIDWHRTKPAGHDMSGFYRVGHSYAVHHHGRYLVMVEE